MVPDRQGDSRNMAILADQHHDLGKLLLDEGLITEQQLSKAREAQVAREKSIGRILVDMGAISEQAKIVFLSKKLKYEMVDIRGVQIPSNILTRIPLSYAEKYCCVPLLIENDRLVVAMEDPTNIVVIDEIKAQTGMEIMPVVAVQADIEQAIQQYPRMTQAQADAVMKLAQTPFFLRMLHTVLFLLIMVGPLIAFWLFASRNDQFGNYLSKLGEPFDIALYLSLLWSLWAILVWELDSLIFSTGRHSRQD